MYSCEIRDEFNMVESAAICRTVNECAVWYFEHGVNFYNPAITMKSYESSNVIASYSFKKG